MGTFDIDPSRLEGEELSQWYRRTPDQIEAEREAARVRRFDEFFSLPPDARHDDIDAPSPSYGREGWQEARAPFAPPAPLTSMTPGGARVGPPEAAPGLPAGGPRDGFFDTYEAVPNSQLGSAYITGLPQPLNVVTPRFGGWFELGDGTLVKGDEVERIHAEQQQRMRGEVDLEPPAQVHASDRFRDGSIPRADQLQKDQRELDATCHPYGGWERDPGFQRIPERSQRYQTQITRAPDLDYVVRIPGERAVKFDGCAVWDPRHQLLEAKGPGYAGLVEDGRRYNFFDGLERRTANQAGRQARASRGRLVEWHVAEPDAVPFFRSVLRSYPSLGLRQTPPR